MGTGHQLQTVAKRWTLFASVVLLCLLAGAAVTATTTRTYSATARLFVSVVLPNDPAALAATNTFATARVQSYVSLVGTPSVTDAVVRQLDLPMSSRALASRITADAPLNKVLINISVSDTSAPRAAQIANAVADRFVVVVADLERTSNPTAASPVRVTVIGPASTPSTPLRPRSKLNLALALLAGLLLAYGALQLRERYDDPVTRPDELERSTGAPVLAVLPGGRGKVGRRAAQGDRALAVRAGALLVDNLQQVGVGRSPGVIAVTSLSDGEGKTLVAMSIGRRLGASGTQVCIVDTNLRAPALAARFGARPGPGLSAALAGPDTAETYLQQVAPEVYALPAGPRSPNPGELLSLPQTAEVMARLSRRFGCILLDGGSMQPYDDGLRASRLATAVVVVVSATHRSGGRQLTRVVRTLEADGVRVLGCVLNQARDKDATAFLARYAPTEPAAESGRGSVRIPDLTPLHDPAPAGS